MAVLRAYFDESERDGYLAVAGCLFESPKARKFEREWRSVFADYGGNCHWVDLIHRRKQFEAVGDKRDDLIKKAIPILGDRIECGVIAACNIRDAAEFALDTDGYRTAYGLCCWRAMDLIMQVVSGTGPKAENPIRV